MEGIIGGWEGEWEGEETSGIQLRVKVTNGANVGRIVYNSISGILILSIVLLSSLSVVWVP